jgi:hypothetical protein
MQRGIGRAIAAEFGKAPIQTTGTIIALLATVITSTAGWWLSSKGVQGKPANLLPATFPEVLGRRSLAVAMFLASSTAGALLSRIVFKFSKVSAFFVSIIAADIAVLLSQVGADMAGLRVSYKLPDLANLIFYSVMMMFLAINGEMTAKSFLDQSKGRTDSERGDDAIASLFFAAVVLGIWGSMVGFGQTLIERIFFS